VPLDCRTWITMRALSMSSIRCLATSDSRRPATWAVIRMARCLGLSSASRNWAISSVLRTTGSLLGVLGRGTSVTTQSLPRVAL
jgi:hypothetical protein